MEKLLNKLIEKGWEPFGSYKDIITRYKYNNRFFEFNHEGDNMVSIRELVSKESGLWQFVCENGMVKLGGKEKKRLTPERLRVFDGEYQYRIIESSLCDEDKLEEFLLSNINVNGTTK